MTNADKDSLRRDREALVCALKDAGAVFLRGNAIRCPFHDDRSPSMGIYVGGQDGAYRAKCHGCGFHGDVFDVEARRQGKDSRDLLRQLAGDGGGWRPRREDRGPRVWRELDELEHHLEQTVGPVEARYVYAHPQTRVRELVVFRLRTGDGGKQFRQASPAKGGGWVQQAPAKPWPIYNRSRVSAADTVIVVEGEKAVHALAEIGIVATTSPCGAGKAEHADWSMLAGKKVYLWPDNDPVNKQGKRDGIEHMRGVQRELEKLSPRPELYWIHSDTLGLPDKGDVVEYLAMYGGASDDDRRVSIQCALDAAVSLGASAGVLDLIEQSIAGKRKVVPLPWWWMGTMSNALFPGTITTICGDPNCAKSPILLEMLTYWHRNGVPCAVFELEENRDYHMLRVLAQLESNVEITQPNWIEKNPQEARDAYARHAKLLDELAARVWDSPQAMLTLDQLAEWTFERAKEGNRIIAIDPITAAETSEKPWIDDQRFIMRAKRIADDFGASVVLVTHPRKGKRVAGNELHDLSGGAAYQRFVQTCFWLHMHPKGRRVELMTTAGPIEATVNRSWKIAKARNAGGAGAQIGGDFVGKSLCFHESGMILRDVEDDDAARREDEEQFARSVMEELLK